MPAPVPEHLKPFVAQQRPELYTFIDHASWRYIMRVAKAFFKDHAHQKYLEGLEATGITIERIPLIEEMDEKLQKFGWRAAGVIGFIPPAIFLEFQALGILPIGCDMRTLDHIAYTPAPDIVHEAAGHAPIIADPQYAQYLKRYGEAAHYAIFSDEDMKVYEAIRYLSDIKENPKSTPAEIMRAEKTVEAATNALSYVSEATQLSRIAWWTIEYGLVGDLKHPKIYGSGLLSSVQESYDAILKGSAKFVPLTIDCINMNYDITKPQPQLYVTPDFQYLSKVLGQFVETMAFKRGGIAGLERAKKSKIVTTTVYDSALQVSGLLSDFLTDAQGHVAYLQFKGPTQLAMGDQELKGQGPERHGDGFGSPVGLLKSGKSSADLTEKELKALGFEKNQRGRLEFASGIVVEGVLQETLRKKSQNILLTFKDCKVTWGERVLFQPAWGEYDMACGAQIISVFGGAADRAKYLKYTGEIKGIVIEPKSNLTAENKELNQLYGELRQLREKQPSASTVEQACGKIAKELEEKFPNDWLLRLEIFELANQFKIKPAWKGKVLEELKNLAATKPELTDLINRGLVLLEVSGI